MWVACSALCLVSLGVRAYGLTAIGPDGSNALAVHALGKTGQGVSIGLLTVSNPRTTHEDFKDPCGVSHVFANNATTDGAGIVISSHDTWIAGIAAGRGGSANPQDVGVAPGADVYDERVVTTGGSVNTAFVQTALDNLVSHGCHVVYSGFQMDPSHVTPDGSSAWTVMYDYYADTYNIVFANPAGNYSGTDPNISVFGDAYNGITTGGLAYVEPAVWRKVGSISCLGPTVDGRRKPDVVGPSQGQTMPDAASDTAWLNWPTAGGETSLSTPHTAGVAALLLSLANSTTEANDGQNEVIRAIIVNSTFPNIRDNLDAGTTGQTYNTARGYGRLDALDAYQTLAASKLAPNGHTTASKGWAYDSVKNSTDTFYVSATKNQRFRVTLTWNRKVTKFGSSYIASPLTNLTLQVTDSGGQSVFQEATSGDNLRKCDILLASTSEYRIKVGNSTGTSTDYGLAFEIVPPITGDLDLNYQVDYLDVAIMAAQWLSDGTGLVSDVAAPLNHVDFADFAILANNWLQCNKAYLQGY
jgi:hypothetical protein